MKAATKEIYKRSADEMILQRCRAREDHQRLINTYNKTIRDLEEANAEALKAKNQEIEALRKRIAELEAQNQ